MNPWATAVQALSTELECREARWKDGLCAPRSAHSTFSLSSSAIPDVQQDRAVCARQLHLLHSNPRPLFFSPDDPLFRLLHLRPHWGHPEFSVPPGSDEEDLFPLPPASRLHVSGMHWDRRLHPLFVAHLSTRQLWTEEDVLRKGAFSASLPWNGWESEFCAFSSLC